ncbi:hypothetical protein [Streptomyces sp. bgisy082]|uniref:hypothetical protein n=1 Tax=Streptomyces sp. bgisy082 TaxID=3413776 RepID=UPI003D70DA8A
MCELARADWQGIGHDLVGGAAPAGAAPRPPALADRHPATARAVAALLTDR